MYKMISRYGNEIAYARNDKEKQKYIELGFTVITLPTKKGGKKSGKTKSK